MKRTILFAGLFLALFAAMGTGIFLYAPNIIRAKAEIELNQAGFPKAAIGAVALTPDQIRFSDIKLDEDGFSTIDNVTAGFGWKDLLLNHRVRDVTLGKIELTAIDDTDGFSLAGWQPASNGAGTIPDLSTLPFDSLSWRSVTLDTDTPWGAIRLESKGQILPDGKGGLHLQGAIDGEQSQLVLKTVLTGDFNPAAGWKLEADINEGRIDLNENVGASRIGGWLSLSQTTGKPAILGGQITAGLVKAGPLPLQGITAALSGTLPDCSLIMDSTVAGVPGIKTQMNIARTNGVFGIKGAILTDGPDSLLTLLRNLGLIGEKEKPVWATNLPPLSLAFSSLPSVENPWIIPLSAMLKTDDGRLSVTSELALDVQNKAVSGTIKTPPLKTADLSVIEQTTGLKATAGTVAIDGKFAASLTDVAIKGPLTVRLDAISLENRSLAVENLNGKITLADLFPPRTNQPAALSFSSANAGLPLTNGQISIAIKDAQSFTLTGASAAFAGGTISAVPLTFVNGKAKDPARITVSGLDTAQLMQQMNAGDFHMTGLLDGTLGLDLSGKSPVIRNGTLHNRDTGTISYNPQNPPAFLQGADERMTLVRQALQSFDYNNLTVELSGPLNGDMKAKVTAGGYNHPLFADRPINLNLNLEGPLPAVLTGTANQ